MKKPKNLESPVSRDCHELLKLNHIPHWRNNVLYGKFKGFDEDKFRTVKNGTKGLADWAFFLDDGSGQTVYIEIKKPVGGIQSENQKNFEKDCIRRGIPYYIISSVVDLEEVLEIYGMLKRRLRA